MFSLPLAARYASLRLWQAAPRARGPRFAALSMEDPGRYDAPARPHYDPRLISSGGDGACASAEEAICVFDVLANDARAVGLLSEHLRLPRGLYVNAWDSAAPQRA